MRAHGCPTFLPARLSLSRVLRPILQPQQGHAQQWSLSSSVLSLWLAYPHHHRTRRPPEPSTFAPACLPTVRTSNPRGKVSKQEQAIVKFRLGCRIIFPSALPAQRSLQKLLSLRSAGPFPGQRLLSASFVFTQLCVESVM